MPKRTKTQIALDNYDKACTEIITKFCEKQGLEFDFWVADEVGNTASFALQYTFTLTEIVHDLRTKQKKGLILKQQIEMIENYFETNTAKVVVPDYYLA
jgi:hypothetical protein